MKKIVALVLVAVMAFALCACSQSAEMKAYESAAAALPSEINYDSWDAIAAAQAAYDALSDAEKSKADTSALDSAKAAFLALPIVDDCAFLKSKLANPESMKLFGDVTRYIIHKENADDIFFTCAHFDGLNANAVYTGSTRAEIKSNPAGDRAVYIEGGKYFSGIEDMTKWVTVEKLAEMGVDIVTVSGQAIAAAIDCEYVD